MTLNDSIHENTISHQLNQLIIGQETLLAFLKSGAIAVIVVQGPASAGLVPPEGPAKKPLPQYAYHYKNGEPAPYTEHELMTVKEAEHRLQVSPDKLYRMRMDGELTSLYKKRNVRLIRAEVEAAYEWYTKMKK